MNNKLHVTGLFSDVIIEKNMWDNESTETQLLTDFNIKVYSIWQYILH